MSTSPVCHFGTEIDMDLQFFALVHKYFLVLDSIRIEKVIFFFFFGGCPLKLEFVKFIFDRDLHDFSKFQDFQLKNRRFQKQLFRLS